MAVSTVVHSDWVCPACGEAVRSIVGSDDDDSAAVRSRFVCPNAHEAAQQPIHRADWERGRAEAALGDDDARTHRAIIFAEIEAERERQDVRWGTPADRNLPLPIWLTILTEEVGEVAQAILKGATNDDYESVDRELDQVGAVVVAMKEAIRAGAAPWGIAKGDAG